MSFFEPEEPEHPRSRGCTVTLDGDELKYFGMCVIEADQLPEQLAARRDADRIRTAVEQRSAEHGLSSASFLAAIADDPEVLDIVRNELWL